MIVKYILAIDPGEKPGYALLDATQLISVETKPACIQLKRYPVICSGTSLEAIDSTPPDQTICLVEDQFFGGAAGKKSLKTLIFRAGQQVGRVQDRVSKIYTISPTNWRIALFGGNLSKEVSNNRVLANLSQDEQMRLYSSDVLDAIGIGWSWLSGSKRAVERKKMQ